MADRKYAAFGLADFISKRKNILFITGYMGSGKSTLAKSFAEKYNAVCITLDVVFDWNDAYNATKKGKPEQEKFRELLEHAGYFSKYDGIGTFTQEWKNLSASQKCEVLIKQAIMDCSVNNRIILEGVQLYHYPSIFNLYINNPLVILSTTPGLAQRSKFKRALDNGSKFFTEVKKIPYDHKYYKDQYVLFQDFLKHVVQVKGRASS